MEALASRLRAGGQLQARAGEVKWRPSRGGRWRSWPAEAPRGDVTFVLIRDGVTVSRAIAAVAPSGFSVTAKAGARRALSVAGLQGATVTIAGTSKNVPSADPLTVERPGGAGSHFDLDAIWPDGTSWRTELYDRTARPGFTNSAGAELPPGWRGCIDALFGIYASCPDWGKLTLEITVAHSTRCITRPIRGETPLYALSTDIRALMATTSRLDAAVRLQWIGAGDHHVEIGLFDVMIPGADPLQPNSCIQSARGRHQCADIRAEGIKGRFSPDRSRDAARGMGHGDLERELAPIRARRVNAKKSINAAPPSGR